MLMATVMASKSISSRNVILFRVAVGVVGKAVAVVRVAVGAAAKLVVAVNLEATNKGVLESGTSAVRGSQARMAGLPRLTRHRGPLRNQMPQPAS
jgi:hypothetical protein